MRQRGLGFGALATVMLMAGCSSGGSAAPASTPPTIATPATPTTFDLAGTVTLYGAISTGVDAMRTGAPCIGITNSDLPSEDFEDVGAGTDMTVTDGSGSTVGVGQLAAGKFQQVNPLNKRACVFAYSISGITAGRGFYRLTIGDHATKTYRESEFEGLTDLSLQSAMYSG